MNGGRTSTGGPGVAITGMACLFPAAPDLDAYWHNILGKVDATSDPPPEAWDPDVYYDPTFTDTDRTYCKRGGYLGPLAAFEPLAHGIPPVAVGGEPDQWLALRVARDALADARALELPEAVRRRTGIVLGKGTYLNGGNAIAVQRGLVVSQTIELIGRLHPEHTEEELEALRDELQSVLPDLGPETVPGLIPNIIVGRVANRLDLMGPAYTVDAACASSLVAVRHAVRDLIAGECDLALAGGSQVWMPVATMNLFCRLGALSRRQELRPFDKDADGTLLGEGIGIVVLKRLDDAMRDGDRVYAVIRGVGVSSDGRGVSVMAPRVDGEELALRRAYEQAGVAPTSVGLIEAHGTGTPVGDAAEVQALTRVFGERDHGLPQCALGSVKSMISHTIPAAGVAGLIKTALALHHKVLPPTLNCDQPNPELGLERSPFYINTELRPWIHGGSEPRRAGINAFGFGGINAHAVLEELEGGTARESRVPWASEVCILEAESAPALAEQARQLAAALDREPEFSLADLAFSLSRALGDEDRSRSVRLALVASSLEELSGKLALAIDKLEDPECRRVKGASGIHYEREPLGGAGKIAFVFPGEGAQYPNMLLDLCTHFAEARAAFDRIDRLYADHPRGHVLSDWVFPRPAFSDGERRRAEQRLMELDIAVESVLTANAAVHAVVRRLVPRVDAMVGHSTGEHSAAMAAGALDLDTDERLKMFCHGLHDSYADAASRHAVPGAVLLAIGADAATAERIAAATGGELYLAMDNCPHQAVLVGGPEAVEAARALATGEGLMCQQLPYDRAVHTPLFAPFAEDLRKTFARLPMRSAGTALWSCTTAAPCPEDPAEIRELLVEHWTRPVRFRETIEALHAEGVRLFVEVGPRGNMTAFIEDILRGLPACAVAADSPRRPGVTQLCHLVATLAVHGAELDLEPMFENRRVEEIDWRAAEPIRPSGPGTAMPLSTAWPMLRLSDEALGRLMHESADRRVAADGNGHGDPARIGRSARSGAPSAASTVTPAEPAPARPLPAPAPPTPARAQVLPAPAGDVVAVGDDVDAAVTGHLRTMERFLHASARVMEAYLAGGGAATTEEDLAAGGAPLLGTIVACEPGTGLVARRTFDPAEDRYLLDHALGRGVSRGDPALSALALMPLAMSIEILAEAASCLLPGRVVTGLRDISAHRWLAFGERPLTLEITARSVTGDGDIDRVRVELREVGNESGPGPIVEGIVLLGAAYPPAPAATLELAEGEPASLAPGRLYDEVMFHQPLWQGVRSVDAVAPAAVRATLQTLSRAELLRSTPQPGFVLDPVLLDAAGQAIGFWAAECLDRARIVFPFRVEGVDLYAPPPPEGERFTCTAAIRRGGDALLSSEIEVAGPEGTCRMRLSGWEDKRFEVPDAFRPLTSPGPLAPLSVPWQAPIAGLEAGTVACRRLDGRLGADTALWKPVWASRVLSRRERELFAALEAPERRQLEWLAARTAAKEAVAALLRSTIGIELPSADIEIIPDARGAPVVSTIGAGELQLTPVVSLTHCGGVAAALAALAAPGSPVAVGIDVEELAPRPPGFAEAALTEPERELLEPLADTQTEEWLLRCWCAREAAGKALGGGLAAGEAGAKPRVAAIAPESGAVEVEIGGVRLSVLTGREASLIVASVIHRQPGGDS